MAQETRSPIAVVISGPNGAGKSTSAKRLLPEGMDLRQFVNADVIAQRLSAFEPEAAAFQAGRVMLERLQELAKSRRSFAFETTLASRTFAPFLKRLRGEGYRIYVVYVWLRSPDLAIARVAARVRRGGHFVPEEVVRRRYQRGLHNFLTLYQPLSHTWVLCDNSGEELLEIATGGPVGRTSWTGSSTMKSSAALEKPHNDEESSLDFAAKVMRHAGQAVREAIAEHHRAGDPVSIWRAGRIVLLYPDGSIRDPELTP